ncbi:hypothetical protein QA645_16990 [Bradyrhizobium sp. CIAT3101]|uniref:hypothetical protein n=1 Tax=Bradyrhizobium sp. CIAT3101 TaxID=439387 RepID=UPI0024B0D02A|nr:hypothetical protein [Bradyrhizobium sp. CIAT3101]WFU84368.1 hypothetical protein QA645_16990 [Bradyrhizobium sp. CIAT3101]
MPTAPELLKSFPAITGFRASTVNAVYRTEREDGLIPKCEGSSHADVDSTHATLLLLGCVADVPAHNAAKAAQLYYDLRDKDGNRAGDAIAAMLDSFDPRGIEGHLSDAVNSYNAYVVVDLERPRISIVRERAGRLPTETVFGVKAAKSREEGVSTTKRISGKVLFELAAFMNTDHWTARVANAA